jgi:5-(carboxyamino)imidazole ribonucleotide mutase
MLRVGIHHKGNGDVRWVTSKKRLQNCRLNCDRQRMFGIEMGRWFSKLRRMNSESSSKPQVGILMGSDSDWPIMKAAADVLKDFGIASEARVISAHRDPRGLEEYVNSARERGLKAIIAGAGGAAHLPGVTAAMTTLPVIGVPIQGKALDGMDSLLSIVQMPPGVPVATVGINAAKNAGILAVQILATGDAKLQQSLADFKVKLMEESRAKNATLTKS